MKATISVIAGLLVLLACCGCSRTCTCRAEFMGETFMEEEIMPGFGKSCNFYNDTVVVMGIKRERKCSGISLDGIL